MEWHPTIRSDVTLEADDDGGASLLDPVMVRRVRLGEVSRVLVPLLDGSRTVDAAIDDALAARPGTTADEARDALRTLARLCLVAGAGEDILARMRRLRAGEAAYDPVFLPDARFACQGSGACCRNYTFGPLKASDVERLQALDAGAICPAGPDWLASDPWDPDSKDGYVRSVDGHCVFQLDDGRCAVHARFGYEAKPDLCRLYPLFHLPTLDGWKVFTNGECATYGTSTRAGEPLAAQADRIRAMFPETFDLHHPFVFLDRDQPCDYGFFLGLQRAVCAGPAAPGEGADAALAAIADRTRAWIEAMTACPLEAGEPDATAARVLAAPPAAASPPAPPSSEALDAVVAIADDLLAVVLAEVARGRETPLPSRDPPPTHDCAVALHLLQALAAHHRDPARNELLEYYGRIASTPIDEAVAGEVLGRSLREQFFGGLALLDGRPAASVLRLGLVYAVARLGARLRAAEDGLPAAGAAELDRGHMMAMRTLRPGRVTDVARRHQAQAWAAVDALRWLAR